MGSILGLRSRVPSLCLGSAESFATPSSVCDSNLGRRATNSINFAIEHTGADEKSFLMTQ